MGRDVTLVTYFWAELYIYLIKQVNKVGNFIADMDLLITKDNFIQKLNKNKKKEIGTIK